MGNIVNDIVEDIEIKPNKSKRIIKWIISISVSLIGLAFVFGQFKSSFFNRMDRFEESLNKNTTTIEEMKTDMNKGFDNVNGRVDKVYDDASETFEEYQEFNKKQLILVLDYGQTNKEMLKEMLELNMQEKTKTVQNQLIQAKTEPVVSTDNLEFSIKVIPLNEKGKNYHNEVYFIKVESNDTIFNVTGATMDYINKINKNLYEVGIINESTQYPKRYDFSYRNK